MNRRLSPYIQWNGIHQKSRFILFLTKVYEILTEESYVRGSKFLRLFFTALSKLPSTGHRIIFRGVKLDLREQYKEGECIVWWDFSSCTKSLAVLENEQFVGTSGTRTFFTIESDTGKDIREHSFLPKEDEILLLPSREFKVVSSAYMGNQLTMIHLKEFQPAFPNLPRLPSSNPPLSIPTVTIPSAITVTAPSVQPKPIIQPVEVSYSWENLTDNDIPGVVKEALQQKQCTILHLSHNRITHEGAALLSKALRHNEVSLCVETVWTSRWNQPLIQLFENEKKIEKIEFDQWTHQAEDRTSICLSEVSSFFPCQWTGALLSRWSDINPRRSLSEDKFCLISSSRRIRIEKLLMSKIRL